MLNHMLKAVTAVIALPCLAAAALIPDVRAAVNAGDFPKAEAMIDAYRMQRGATPETIEAHSWLGRGALAQKRYEDAIRYAQMTREQALAALKNRKLDDEPHLPTALGASIEVQGHAMAGRGERAAGVGFLRQELKTWHATSIRTRIQKNLHLLSLEGTAPPPLEWKEFIGSKPPSLAALKGKPVLLFFWAHWCSDCKKQAPILAELKEKYGPKGLQLMGPTQCYGYVAGGEDAPREKEIPYIAEVRRQFYGALDLPAPVNEENFKVYGVSSTPTLVLLDRKGVVRMYHPGRMPLEELAPKIEAVLR